ncbi:MAG: DUF1015 domain-containing protein [Candidatus Limivicinus sp.]
MTETEKTINACFSAADILIPDGCDLQRWAVIACDQFTSQPSYWRRAEEIAAGVPSAMHLILPESELDRNPAERIRGIHENMLRYLNEGIFRRFPDCYVYTERRLHSGSLRRGLIGRLDLERYDYTGAVNAAVRATELTVSERIPPRMAVRRGAVLELPHVLLLCNDERRRLIEPLGELRDSLPKLYDFDLMLGGGHVAGWLVSGEEKQRLDARIAEYEARELQKHPHENLLYAVGDGNHSLATAKACYEEQKALQPDVGGLSSPARYALCELNNIHDPVQVFEPIHRVVKHCDADLLIRDASAAFPEDRASCQGTICGTEIPWLSGGREGRLLIPEGTGLPLQVLQDFLDRWLSLHPGELDYIHGGEALAAMAGEPGCVGFRLPPIPKEALFPEILSGGVLPRKTFSMGEAEEKRYYLEARRILPPV